MFHSHTSCLWLLAGIDSKNATDSKRGSLVCHKYLWFFAVVAVAVFATVASPTTALGDTITLSSSADADVFEYYPNTNYGTILNMMGVSGQAGYRERAYVKFNLSSIPSGSTIDSVTLRLYCRRCYTDSESQISVALKSVGGSWTETGLTWNNQPSLSSTLSVAQNFTSTGWHEWNSSSFSAIKILVQRWFAGTETNNGFRLQLSDENYYPGDASWWSKEYSTSSMRPQLVVNYTPPPSILSGTITNSRTAEGIAGASIGLFGANQSTTSDASGNYSFQNLTAKTYTLTVTKTGYPDYSASVSVSGNTIQNVSRTPYVTITSFSVSPNPVNPGGQLTITYVLNNSANSAQTVWLGCSLKENGKTWDQQELNDLDDDTSVSVPVGNSTQTRYFDTGSSYVICSYDVRVAIWRTKQSGLMVDRYDFKQTDNAVTVGWSSLSGTVINSRTAENIAGATVELWLSGSKYSGPVTTTADGSYSFTDIPANTYVLKVFKTGYPDYSNSVNVSGATTRNVSRTPYVTFTSFSVSPNPVNPGGRLTITYSLNNSVNSAQTVWLGCSLKENGKTWDQQELNDLDDDISVSVPVGNSTQTRYFDTGSNYVLCPYDGRAAIWRTKQSGLMVDRYDFKQTDNAVSVTLPDAAKIVSFVPPTGTLERGVQATASVRVKNTGTTTRDFWVGLSFAHETASNANWPYGWYDIYPIKTSQLSPNEEQTVMFEFVIPETLQAGQYYAVASVWDNFDVTSHLMDGERFDDTRNYPTWCDVEIGKTSFSLQPFALSQDNRTIVDQLKYIIGLSRFIGTLEDSYRNGDNAEKPLLAISKGTPSGTNIAGVPIYVGGSILIDLADLFEITPEGKEGWVTVWIAGEEGLSLHASILPMGIIKQGFLFRERGFADYRPNILAAGEVRIPGLSFTTVSYDEYDGWKGPKLEWNGQIALHFSVLNGKFGSLISREVNRQVILDALTNAATPGINLNSYVVDLIELLAANTSSGYRVSTYDDGDWAMNPGQWEANLKMRKLWDNPFDFSNYFSLDVPENTSELRFISTGGTGNANLHVRYGQRPDGLYHEGEYTYGSNNTNNEENITISNPPSGKFYIMLAAITEYDSVNLVANLTTSAPILLLTPENRNVSSSNGSTNFSVSNSGGGTMSWTAQVVDGNSWLSITSGSSGTNSGTIQASFTSNTTVSTRIGTIHVTATGVSGSPEDVTITQAGTSVVQQYNLTTNVQGQGSITINPSGGVYDSGTQVQLTANAWPSWHFVGWEGDITGSTNPTTITMNSNKSVAANMVAYTIVTNLDNLSVPEGGTSTFGVKLNMQPPGSVTVSVSRVSGDSDISVSSGGSLPFTTSNWNTYQPVTLAAAEDADAIDGTATIVCSATGWTSKNVTATESDNDRELLTNTQTVSVPEGGTAIFQVKLKAQPASDVQVSVSRVSGDSDISVSSGGNPVFTTSNWNTYQPVTLASAEDADAIDGVATIRCSAPGWAGKDVIVTENDNDREFVTTAVATTVPENGTTTFQIRLKGQPSGTVAVTVSRLSGDSDISVSSGGNPVFTTINWSTNQTVTLAAAVDPDAANGTAIIRCSATGWANKDIVVTEDDAQGSFTITSPSGGVKWEQGTAHNIAWTSSGNPGPEVKIEYSPTNGSTWYQIIASTENDSSYPWTVPDMASTQCLVRVTSTTKPEITNASAAIFTVIGSAHHLAFGTQPTNTIATEGTTPVISPSPSVKICDAAGSTVTSSSANVAIGLVGGGGSSAVLLGTTTKAAVSGVATFSDLRVTSAGTNFQLQTTSTGLTSANSAVFTVVAEPALTIEMEDDTDPVDANDQVTYTITYGNTGLAAATNVVITEALPSSLSFISATGGGTYSAAAGTVTWNIGTIPVQTTGRTATFIAKVKADMAEGGTITHSNLTIDCDQTGPATAAAETTTVNDKKTPETSGLVPASASIQAGRDTIIQLHITDGGSGVDFGTVTIRVEDNLIYDGANETSEGIYDSMGNAQAVRGICKRVGTPAAYTFVFRSWTLFDYEQKVDVAVAAADVAGNKVAKTYYFYTVMRSFGKNAKVNSDTGSLAQDHPASVTDSAGNIWVVWDQTTGAGDTDIYIGKLAAGGDAFGGSVSIYSGPYSQSYPVIAIDGDSTLYVAWQGQKANNLWDIYVSKSTNGTTWSNPVVVNVGDPNNKSNQTKPSIGIDVPAPPFYIYVAYQDDRAGNSDIWVASSTNGTSWTERRVTSNTSEQTDPVVGVLDPLDTPYVLWTDARNSAGGNGLDIYAAAQSDGWTEYPIVAGAGNEYKPATERYEMAHTLWVKEVGGFSDIFYGNAGNGMPLIGIGITDEPNIAVSDPAIALRVTGGSTKVFAAWTDGRDVSNNNDTDIYYAESNSPLGTINDETGSPFGHNVLVNDDIGTNSQSSPVVNVDSRGNPYVVWVDERNGNKDIYYAGATALDDPLATTIVIDGSNMTVKASSVENLQVAFPMDALPAGVDVNNVNITIAELLNPPELPVGGFGVCYDFGPSGLQFNPAATITIPHSAADCPGYSVYKVYCYNAQSGTWSQDGISNVQHKAAISGTVHTVSFQAMHFTAFVVGGSTVAPPSSPPPSGDGGGGGGGCDMSPNRPGNLIGYLLPYALLSCAWLVIRRKDARNRGAI